MANLKNVQELNPSTSWVEGDEAVVFIKCNVLRYKFNDKYINFHTEYHYVLTSSSIAA